MGYADTNDYHWPLLSTHLPELETALEKAGMNIVFEAQHYGNTGCGVFKRGVQN